MEAYGLQGIVVVLGIIVLISWDRKNICWKSVVKAIIAQFIIAILLVKVPVGKMVVSAISDGVTVVINCGQTGIPCDAGWYICKYLKFNDRRTDYTVLIR